MSVSGLTRPAWGLHLGGPDGHHTVRTTWVAPVGHRLLFPAPRQPTPVWAGAKAPALSQGSPWKFCPPLGNSRSTSRERTLSFGVVGRAWANLGPQSMRGAAPRAPGRRRLAVTHLREHAPGTRNTFKPASYITQHILPHPCGRSFLEPASNLLVHLLVLMCCSPPLKGEMVRRPQGLFCFISLNLG